MDGKGIFIVAATKIGYSEIAFTALTALSSFLWVVWPEKKMEWPYES
jgi:hypothetical protein